MKTICCYGDSNTWGYDSRSAVGERYPQNIRWTGILTRETGFRIVNDGMNGRTIPAGGFAPDALAGQLAKLAAECAGQPAERAGQAETYAEQAAECAAQEFRPCGAAAAHRSELFLWVMLGTNDLLNRPDGGAAYAAVRMQRFLRKLLTRLPAAEDGCIPVRLIAPPALRRGAWVETDALVQESHLLGPAFRAVAAEEGIRFTDLSTEEIPLLFDGVHLSAEGHGKVAERMLRVIREEGG